MSDPQATVDPQEARLLAQAEAVVARFPAKGAEKLAAQAAAATMVAEYQALAQPHDALTYGVVRMMRAAGRYEEALALLRTRRPVVPEAGRAILFSEAELCLFTGRTAEGDALLAQLEAGGTMRPSWLRSIARIRAKAELAAAAEAEAATALLAAAANQESDGSGEAERPTTLLERVLAINDRFPVKEAHKYSVRAAADQALADYRAEPEPSHELTYAVIRMLRALRRYPPALELIAQRRPMIEGKTAEIDFYEIDMVLRTRQREAGTALLEKFFGAGHALRPGWKRSLAKLERKFESLQVRDELHALQESLCQLATDVDLDMHLPLLRAALPGHNEALEVLLFVEARIQALRQLAPAAAADLSLFEKYHRAKLVFTCGFSWSGSGAVSGFLAQHKQVTLPFGTSEMAYLQGRDGRRGIFQFLSPGPVAPDAMRKLLARFFMESVVALTRPHYSPMAKCIAAEQNRIGVLAELVDDFNAAMFSAGAMADAAVRRQVVAMFLQRLFSVLGGTHVLLNNVFLAPRAAVLGTMEDALFIVVERDARDQYIARKIESGHAGDDDIEKFSAMLRHGRAKFQAIRQAATPEQLERQLWLVKFEDFLRDETLRQDLLLRLRLPPEGMVPDKDRFDPAVSLGNVGIHADQLTPEEQDHLERELGLYMP